MDALPFTGEQTTWSVKPGAGPDLVPDYVPDSASTGTAWSTGRKTIDERISQGPSTALDVPGPNNGFETVLERAQRAGMRTGDVSTAEITDATPAVMGSHISNRACQGPNDTRNTCKLETKAAGGLGSIAEQEVDHGIDVILGGGKGRFDQTLDGSAQTVTGYAQAQRGYRLVTDAAGLDAVGDLGRPVLGLFNASNMSLEWNGPTAGLQQADGGYGPPVTCQTDRRPANEPSLAAMTSKAIDLLDRGRKGFFLQVEGASIDKRDHAANPCQQIGETIAFDRATGTEVRIAAVGPQAARVNGVIDETDINGILTSFARGGRGR